MRSLLNLVLVVILGGFAAAALVRYSPGFDVDENSWNPRISASTLAAIHARHEEENRLPVFYFHYLEAAARGDLGQSDSLRTPVAELIRERAPVSAGLVFEGVLGGLGLGAILAWLAVWPRMTAARVAASCTSGLLVAIPPAVLGLVFFFREAPLGAALALALAPRVFGTLRALLGELYSSGALLAARARGVGAITLASRYVVGRAAPQLMALTGVAVVLAFGSAIPIEALCDVPGIGQLAWKAALARDLPLLSGLALIITFLAALVHEAGDLLTGEWR